MEVLSKSVIKLNISLIKIVVYIRMLITIRTIRIKSAIWSDKKYQYNQLLDVYY